MRIVKLSLLLFLFVMASCSSLRVTTDYDEEVDFKGYKTFAFYKKGIDKADISDLDKKRIMRAIERELTAKGFTKSKSPDFLVTIFTKSKERVKVNDNSWGMGMAWGWGWGWGNPWMFGGMNRVQVNQYTEGTLFIDFIDRDNKSLFWQGVGQGALRLSNMKKKQARIKLFVKEILDRYPPSDK